MSTAQSLIDDVRSRIVEASADFFSDTVILRWLNQAYKNFATYTDFFEKIKAFPVTAKQYEYDLPSDVSAIQLIRWQDKYTVVWRDLTEFAQFAGFSDQLSDRPYVYRIYPWDSRLRVFPIPSAASASTTLNGAHNSSVTTITLTDATYFPTRGRAICGTEQILWFDKSGNNLLQVVRGDAFTTAASHSNGDTIQYAPMEVYYTYIPPAMVVSTVDSRVPSQYDEALIAYATAICFRAKDKYEIASHYTKVYKEIYDEAMADRAKLQQDRLQCIKDVNEWEVY